MLLNYHIGRFFFGSLCVGDLVQLGLSSVWVAGFTSIFHFGHGIRNMYTSSLWQNDTQTL